MPAGNRVGPRLFRFIDKASPRWQNGDIVSKRKKRSHVSLSPKMFLIVCPLLFLTGFVDAIAGGGGLISLPAYLLAGLPIH